MSNSPAFFIILHVQNPQPQNIRPRLSLSLFVHYWASEGKWSFILDDLRWKIKINQRTVTPIRPRPGNSIPWGAINIAATTAGVQSHSMLGRADWPKKKSKKTWGRETHARELKGPSPSVANHVLDLGFNHLTPDSGQDIKLVNGSGGTVQFAVRGTRGGSEDLLFLGFCRWK